MKTISRSTFTTIKTEGALLPADLLQKIADRKVDGLIEQAYHLAPGERLSEAINRSWNRLQGVWQSFAEQRMLLPKGDSGTTLTRDRWLQILFAELGYGRVPFVRSLEIAEPTDENPDATHSYPISHLWQQTPLHLITFQQVLDRRDPALGRSPHSLLQEFLNRSEEHMWGMVSNGLTLRILRDNASLTRAAYLEFDLESMMNGEQYADFSLLWLVCHQSRVESQVEGAAEAQADADEAELATPQSQRPNPANCWLEKWSQSAVEDGTRALDDLSKGVQEAISALGRGLLRHKQNQQLKEKLRSGELSLQAYNRQLLRIVYRLIFLFVAEDRELLLTTNNGATHGPDGAANEAIDHALIQERYSRFYSVGRLRTLAQNRRGGPHPDLYRGVNLLFTHLRNGYAPLGLPGLGSFIFSENSTPDLDGLEMANSDLLETIRSLAFIRDGRVLRAVDYKNLDSEELGSVYQTLLELHPEINIDAGTFELNIVAGSERKTSGSHYTPPSLVNSLLDTALEPVIADRLARAKAALQGATDSATTTGPTAHAPRITNHASAPQSLESALLSIKICDPACGSGHFLLGAARRMAHHLARIRSGDAEPAPEAIRTALRDVVRNCIYGVDLNEMAVELCKISLWMETLEPGKPLSFLDKNIQHGNSLIGATPALLRRGIPDNAFKPILGDDKEYVKTFKKQNKAERKGQLSLLDAAGKPWERLGNLAASMMQLDAMTDETVDDVRRQEERYAKLVQSSDYENGRLWADAWCAAFVWIKKGENEDGFAYPITEQIFRDIERNPYDCAPWMKSEIRRLRQQYSFFHWHLAFPDVFRPKAVDVVEEDVTGWEGGFDVVLGNPPWERIKILEREWFSARHPDIANARNTAERRNQIETLVDLHPVLLKEFHADKRKAEGEVHVIRDSVRFPLCGRGDFNTYAIFAELKTSLMAKKGRAGFIAQTGLITSDTTKAYFADLLSHGRIVCIYDFDNRKKIFAAVQGNIRFCLLTLSNQRQREFTMAAQLEEFQSLNQKSRIYHLAPDDVMRINPNTLTCPTFKTEKDASLIQRIYAKIPILVDESDKIQNAWAANFFTVFHMSGASDKFQTLESLELQNAVLRQGCFILSSHQNLPVYEAKLVTQYDHRSNTFEGIPEQNRFKIHAGTNEVEFANICDPAYEVLPRYWVNQKELPADKGATPFYLGFRRSISAVADSRSVVASIIPEYGVGDSIFLLQSEYHKSFYLVAVSTMNSFIFDYVLRQKASGGNLSFYIAKQLPFLPPQKSLNEYVGWVNSSLSDWLRLAVLELSFTSYSLQGFARFFAYHGPPFRWDEERRFLLRCELDAAYFHLYGIERDDVDYIMETFPIVKRKDIAAHDEYRTKRVILEIYDEMARAMQGGPAYQTRLDPPPADPKAAHEWDAEYLGPQLDESEWWQEVELEAEIEAEAEASSDLTEKTQIGADADKADKPFELSAPPIVEKKKRAARTPAQPIQSALGPAVLPAAEGSYQERLKQVMALSDPKSDQEIRQLVGFLADPDTNIRWLASGTLSRQGGSSLGASLVLAALSDFLNQAEPERIAAGQESIQNTARLIADMTDDEEVKTAAQKIIQ